MKNFKLSERVADIMPYFKGVESTDVINFIIRLEIAMDQVVSPIANKPLSQTPYVLVLFHNHKSSILPILSANEHLSLNTDEEYFDKILLYLSDSLYRDKIQMAKTITDINTLISEYHRKNLISCSCLIESINKVKKSKYIDKDMTDAEYCIMLNKFASHTSHIMVNHIYSIESVASYEDRPYNGKGLTVRSEIYYIIDNVDKSIRDMIIKCMKE